MKHAFILLVLALAALAAAQEAPSPSGDQSSQPIPTDPENTKKARAVLDQAIEALGGQAYLNFQDVKQEGRSYSFHRGQAKGPGVSFTRTRKLWDKDRVDYTASQEIDYPFIYIDIPVGSSKTHVSLIYNGDKGYEVTNKGVRDMNDQDELGPYLRRRHFSLDAVLRQWLNQPGVALFYEGQTVAAQKPVDQVTVMNAKNEAVTLYLDSNTHLPVKKSFTWRDPTDKQRNIEEEVFDNYRPIQNVMTAFDDTRFFNGEMSGQAFLTKASYNQGAPDTLFSPREVAASKKR
jgi:hypothetical protein